MKNVVNLLLIFAIFSGCGIKGSTFKPYPEEAASSSELCPAGRDYFVTIASPHIASCLSCHTGTKVSYFALDTEDHIDATRQNLRDSRGWAFASTVAHQGRQEFLKMFPNEAAYQAWMQLETGCSP